MSRIVAFGGHAPERRVASAEIETHLGLEAGWIERRTGIVERRYADESEATSDLAVRAGQDALSRAKVDVRTIRMLLLATSTPDHLLPPTAPLVAHRLGLQNCAAIDLANACAGFLAALALADAYCHNQPGSVLIIAANVLSRRINPADPLTAGLFADAAGAVLLEPTSRADTGILAVHVESDGSGYDRLLIPAGGSRSPTNLQTVQAGQHFMQMAHGGEVYRTAILSMVNSAERVLQQAGLTAAEIDWWVPHQANGRIISDVGTRLGFGPERTISIVREYGNSSAASIPLAIALAEADGRIQPGNTLLLTAAGAGMVAAASVLRM